MFAFPEANSPAYDNRLHCARDFFASACRAQAELPPGRGGVEFAQNNFTLLVTRATDGSN
jgi:hypothetical protein